MTLEQFIEKKQSAYTLHLITSILTDSESLSDADELFRRLVLDDSMRVEVAEELYNEAVALIEGRE